MAGLRYFSDVTNQKSKMQHTEAKGNDSNEAFEKDKKQGREKSKVLAPTTCELVDQSLIGDKSFEYQ